MANLANFFSVVFQEKYLITLLSDWMVLDEFGTYTLLVASSKNIICKHLILCPYDCMRLMLNYEWRMLSVVYKNLSLKALSTWKHKITNHVLRLHIK